MGVGEESNWERMAERDFWDMVPSKRRWGIEARVRAGEMRSRKEVNWEKITDFDFDFDWGLDLEVGWGVLRWVRRAAILAEELVPIRQRVMRGGVEGLVLGVLLDLVLGVLLGGVAE